jgi:hypothetical protein
MGDRFGLNVGSVMQLDRWEPLKTGEPTVSPNLQFNCTLFFQQKSQNNVVLYFLFFKNRRNKTEPNLETTIPPWI